MDLDPRYPPQQLDLWVGPPLPVGPAVHGDQGGVAEPARAGRRRRALGWFVDFLVVMVPGLILIGFVVHHLVTMLPAYLGDVVVEIGVPRLIGLILGGGATDGVGAAVAETWPGFVWPLLLALLAVPLLQLVYHAPLLAWRGQTLGKMLTDTRVDGSRRFAVRRAAATTLAETGPVAVGLAVVVYGRFVIGALVLGCAVVVWWVNVLPALGSRRRTVVDRVSGTVVVRAALYTRLAANTAALARRTSGATVAAGQRGGVIAVAAGRRAGDAAVVAGQMGADAAVVAAQMAAAAAAAARQRGAEHFPAAAQRTTDAALAAARVTAAAAADAATVARNAARHGAERVAQTAPVQQALNSKVGQQSQALGAAGAQRARRLARTVGDRTQQLWQERQAARAEQQAQEQQQDEAPQQPALPAEARDQISPDQYFPTLPEQWHQPRQ